MKKTYIETSSGIGSVANLTLCGTQFIHLQGKTSIHDNVVIRGDLANVRLGRRCSICPGAVIRPPWKREVGKLTFMPVSIGDNVIIEENCVVQASWIGANVRIGRGSVIQARCVIKDCCYIQPGNRACARHSSSTILSLRWVARRLR